MAVREWWKVKSEWPVGPYTGTYPQDDPRVALRARLNQPGPDGWVMVQASEIKDVFEMRICRSTQQFDHDEDGPIAKSVVHCVCEAGHRGDHSNGYYTWRI